MHPLHSQPAPQVLSIFLQPQRLVVQPVLHVHPLLRKSRVACICFFTSSASQSMEKPLSFLSQPCFSGSGKFRYKCLCVEFFHISIIQHAHGPVLPQGSYGWRSLVSFKVCCANESDSCHKSTLHCLCFCA